MLSLLPKFSTLPSLVAISLVKVKTQVFQWHVMYHWSRDQRVVSLGVGVSHNISAPCVVWCPCVFSKWIYNASILQHNLRRPPHLGVKQNLWVEAPRVSRPWPQTHSAKLRPEDILRSSSKKIVWTSPYGPLCNAKGRSLLTSWGCLLPTSLGHWNMTSLGRPHTVATCNAMGRLLPTYWGHLLQTLWGRPHAV